MGSMDTSSDDDDDIMEAEDGEQVDLVMTYADLEKALQTLATWIDPIHGKGSSAPAVPRVPR